MNTEKFTKPVQHLEPASHSQSTPSSERRSALKKAKLSAALKNNLKRRKQVKQQQSGN